MASSKEYLQFVLEQLSELQEITYRAMMGEFIIYYRGIDLYHVLHLLHLSNFLKYNTHFCYGNMGKRDFLLAFPSLQVQLYLHKRKELPFPATPTVL